MVYTFILHTRYHTGIKHRYINPYVDIAHAQISMYDTCVTFIHMLTQYNTPFTFFYSQRISTFRSPRVHNCSSVTDLVMELKQRASTMFKSRQGRDNTSDGRHPGSKTWFPHCLLLSIGPQTQGLLLTNRDISQRDVSLRSILRL